MLRVRNNPHGAPAPLFLMVRMSPPCLHDVHNMPPPPPTNRGLPGCYFLGRHDLMDARTYARMHVCTCCLQVEHTYQ